MRWKLVLSTIIAAPLIFFSSGFAQSLSSGEQRIGESITVNGQPATGVLVVVDGYIQTTSCESPQPYVMFNGSESGWACPEQATGMWLLNAQPPSQASTYGSQSPTVIYSDPNAYYGFGYSYPYYYPYNYYGYPYFVGPQFGFGFGFGRSGHVFHDGRGFSHGGFNRGVGGFRGAGSGFGHAGGFRGAGSGFGHAGGFRGGGGFGGHMGGAHMGGGRR